METAIVDSIHLILFGAASFTVLFFQFQQLASSPNRSLALRLPLCRLLRTVTLQYKLSLQVCFSFWDSVVQPMNALLAATDEKEFQAFVEEQGHLHSSTPIWKLRPIINGAELKKEFGLNGAEIGAMLDKVIEWQIDHPNDSAAECRSFLQSLRSSERPHK
jgi:hypothetical protein